MLRRKDFTLLFFFFFCSFFFFFLLRESSELPSGRGPAVLDRSVHHLDRLVQNLYGRFVIVYVGDVLDRSARKQRRRSNQ